MNRHGSHPPIVASTHSFVSLSSSTRSPFTAEAEQNTPGLISAFRFDLDHLILSVIRPISIKSCHKYIIGQVTAAPPRTHCVPHPITETDQTRRGSSVGSTTSRRNGRVRSVKPPGQWHPIYPQRTRLTHATPPWKIPLQACTSSQPTRVREPQVGSYVR